MSINKTLKADKGGGGGQIVILTVCFYVYLSSSVPRLVILTLYVNIKTASRLSVNASRGIFTTLGVTDLFFSTVSAG